jgi:4-hydroxy-tetrahydrodipicolinate reductase
MGEPLRILIVGISGRMGLELIGAAQRSSAAGHPVEVLGGLVAGDDPMLGREIPGALFPAAKAWQDEFSAADVLIDFSSPRGALFASQMAKEQGLPLVCCSTGLSDKEEEMIKETSLSVPMVRARNTSVGITVLKEIVSEAARLLGDSFDAEVMEVHHKHKKDAPSGTAYILLEAVAEAKGDLLKDKLVCGRFGGEAKREEGEIGVAALRGGDVAGEHTVYFFGEGERIEITHRASSRRIFAEGALRAAKWLAQEGGRKPGLYGMLDVLG